MSSTDISECVITDHEVFYSQNTNGEHINSVGLILNNNTGKFFIDIRTNPINLYSLTLLRNKCNPVVPSNSWQTRPGDRSLQYSLQWPVNEPRRFQCQKKKCNQSIGWRICSSKYLWQSYTWKPIYLKLGKEWPGTKRQVLNKEI